jgi:hypothetical protein
VGCIEKGQKSRIFALSVKNMDKKISLSSKMMIKPL